MKEKEVVATIMDIILIFAGFVIGFSVNKPVIFQNKISECKLKGGDTYALYIDFRFTHDVVEECKRIDNNIELK